MTNIIVKNGLLFCEVKFLKRLWNTCHKFKTFKSYNPSNTLNVYNPWRDFDGIYDIGEEAPRIRCEQLENYLSNRVPHAKYIFVAEALGFQGGHFSGIAMTSERILLGNHKNTKIQPSLLITCNAQRTSNPRHIGIKKTQSKMGYNEPTATIVWESIFDSKRNPFNVILWNIFPFHPYKTDLLKLTELHQMWN